MGSPNHTGTVALAVSLAIIVMSGSMMHAAMAQGVVHCLSVAASEAPFADAAAAVQGVRLRNGPCCQSSGGPACMTIEKSGQAEILVCGPSGYCPSCADVGTGVNEVLAQCVTLSGKVLGNFDPDGSDKYSFWITNTS